MRSRSGLWTPLGSAGPVCFLLWLGACTETPLTGVDPGTAPGPTAATVEVVLGAENLPEWRDTALAGFALPGDGGSVLLADGPEFQARALGRFRAVPESIFVVQDSVTVPVDSFFDVSVLVLVDTARANFPELPFTLRLLSLDRSFDEFTVSWTEAAVGVPWTTPGGDLGVEIGSAEVTEKSDTVRIVPTVSSDSLLKAWATTGGEPGAALVLEGTTGTLAVRTVQLTAQAQPAGGGNPAGVTRAMFPPTFIYDPPQPNPAGALRVGGQPAWRSYFVFRLPTAVGGVPLAGADVNRAEVVFSPLASPPGAFVPEAPFVARGVELLGDPFQQGPKTPVGSSLQNFSVLDPDSLALGRPLRLDVTSLVAELTEADAPPGEIRLGVRSVPDGQSFGFWDFGGIDHPDAEKRPRLFLLITPPPRFEVP